MKRSILLQIFTFAFFALNCFVLASSQILKLEKANSISMVWFNNINKNSNMNLIHLPTSGLSKYYTQMSYSLDLKVPVQKTYFSFFDGYSQFYSIMTVICQQSMGSIPCKLIKFNHKQSPFAQRTDNQGFLDVDEDDIKVIRYNSQDQIVLYPRQQWRQWLQYGFTVFIILLVAWSIFTIKIVPFTKKYFMLQYLASIIALIAQSSLYLKQSIQNWNVENWKFLLFLPLIAVIYRSLQMFVNMINMQKIEVKPFVTITVCNFVILYYTAGTNLYCFCSWLLIFNCDLYGQNIQESDPNYVNNKKELRKIRWIYFFIHFRLIFMKQSCYLVQKNPNYFILGITILTFIGLLKILLDSWQEREHLIQQNKFKIKIIQKRSQILAFVPTISDKLNEQCSICYQKIESNWAITPCFHIFHDYCLQQWLMKSQKCPIDRKKVKRMNSTSSLCQKTSIIATS